MENKKTLNLFEKYLIFIYLGWFVILLGFQVWAFISGSGISFASLIYWTVLAGWLYMIKKFKLNSSFSLKTGFTLFIISAFLTLINILVLAEMVMRIAFMGFLIGLIQTFFDYFSINAIKK